MARQVGNLPAEGLPTGQVILGPWPGVAQGLQSQIAQTQTVIDFALMLSLLSTTLREAQVGRVLGGASAIRQEQSAPTANSSTEDRLSMLERNLENLTAGVADLAAMKHEPPDWLPLATLAAVKLKETYGNSLAAVVPRPKIEDGEQLLLLIAQVRMPSCEALRLRDKLLEEWWDGLDDPLKNDVIIGIEHVR